MGIRIGEQAATLETLRGFVPRDNAARETVEPRPQEEASLIGGAHEPPPLRVGFGENTLSSFGAALRTLNGTLERAQDIVPTVEELREALRQRQAEQAARREDRANGREAAPEPKVELVRPDPSPQVRNFTSPEATNRAAPLLESEQVEVAAPAPTPAPAPGSPVTTQRLNLLV